MAVCPSAGKRWVRLGLTLGTLAAACGPPSAEDLVEDVIAVRNGFEIRLTSWIERDDQAQPYLYLDVMVVKNTLEPLATLTILAEQLDANNHGLTTQRIPLDVANLTDGLSQNLGLELRPAHPDVEGVRLFIEPRPPREVWDQFPEFDRVRPRGS